jgi:hypothetical protein
VEGAQEDARAKGWILKTGNEGAVMVVERYCKVSIGVAQWALKSRVEGRKITFARC